MWKLSLAVERSFSSQRCQDFFLSWIRIHALQVLQNTGIAKLALYLPIDPIMDTNTCPAYKSTTHITGSVQSCLGLPLVPAADPKLGENYRRKRLMSNSDDGQGSGVASVEYTTNDGATWTSTTDDTISLNFAEGVHALTLPAW